MLFRSLQCDQCGSACMQMGQSNTLMNALHHTWAELKIMGGWNKFGEWAKRAGGNAIFDVCSFSVSESSMTTAWFACALWSFMCHVPRALREQILLSTNLQMPKCQVILILGEKDANVYLKEILFLCFLCNSLIWNQPTGFFPPVYDLKVWWKHLNKISPDSARTIFFDYCFNCSNSNYCSSVTELNS